MTPTRLPDSVRCHFHVAIAEHANCSKAKQRDSPALEILDVTFAMNLGWAKSREECARLLIYQSLQESAKEPDYHPMLIGEQFLARMGVVV